MLTPLFLLIHTSLLFTILLIPLGSVSAITYPSLRFEKPKIDGEIYGEGARAALVDRYGFLWFCTKNGLDRYDGYTTKRYLHDPDNAQSISGNLARAILEDKNGNLWIGTDKSGLNRFDPKSEIFTRYLQDKLSEVKISHLYEDSFGMIWLSTLGSGLLQLNPETRDFIQYLPNKDDPNSLSHLKVRKVLEDQTSAEGNLWVATSNGLDYFRRKQQSFVHYRPNEKDPSSLSHELVFDLFYDSNGSLWIGTGVSLDQFTPATKKFLHYYPNKESASQVFNGNSINAIHEDQFNNFWIGTITGGLKRFDRKKKYFYEYRHEPYNPYSLHFNLIKRHGLIEDSSGLLWILTETGINYLNLLASPFKNYQSQHDNPDSLSGNHIWEIYESANKHLWFGTYDNGLNYFDEKNNRFIHYRHEPQNTSGISSNFIDSILVDRDQTLWVGTNNRGLNRLDKNDTEFQYYLETIGNNIGNILDLLEDHQGYIWIATTSGLFKYDKRKDHFSQYLPDDNNPNSLAHPWVITLYEDDLERLWIGTDGGLDLYDPENEKFTHFKHNPELENSLSSNKVRTIYQSNDDFLWIGTEDGGLNRLDVKNKHFRHYGQKDGLPSNYVAGVLEDEQGYLWISAESGLSRFDPKTETFRNFSPEDGLLNNSFQISLKRSNGEIILGGSQGFTRFLPSEIIDSSQPPKIALTDFLIFNRSVPLLSSFSSKSTHSEEHDSKTQQTTTENENYYLKQSINHSKQITLTYKESMFSFEFAALDYLSPNKNQYAYQLEGVDKDWITTPANKRFATYMNIPAGEYVFKVKGSNKDGVWNEEGRSLKVIILPPIWLTWWAKLIYVLLTVALLVGIYSYRTSSLRRRALALQHSVETRTLELSQEKNKVEQLLHLKNQEFANVSHEFRTPLTLILAPLAQVIKNLKPDNIDKNIESLGLVQRNGYRLLRMVDQLLNIESFQVNSVTQKQPIAFGETTRLITEAFHGKAKENHIEFSVNEIADINFDFTPDAFDKILLNLLSNAFKYTPVGGHVELSSKVVDNKELKVTVSDNGIGIPLDEQETIYERFSRTSKSKQENIQGAGIGLSLVKSLVEMHHGHISLNSEPNIGSCFDVSLPIVNPVSDNEVKKHTDKELIAQELMSIAYQASFSATKADDNIPNQEHQNKILIIEDNDDMREFIARSIEQNYQILTANDGEQGARIATEEVPDLIISDIMMPKLDGYQVTSQLRSQTTTNHIPIILLTAKNDKMSRLKGWRENADEYLTKPFDVDELNIRVKNLLDIRDILKKRYSGKITITEQNNKNVAINDAQKLQNKFICSLNQVLQKFYTNNQIKIPEIASALAMSERQLFRKMKSSMDMTPKEYLRNYRLEKSKELLITGKNISSIAYEVGFSSQSHFSRCFKAYVGCVPTEYGN